MEQGRDVFAVPGSIDSTGSRGTHKLIKEGAKLIENVYDILDEILPQVDIKQPECEKLPISPESSGTIINYSHKLNERENSVLQIISSKAVAIDDIISQAGLKPNDVLNILLTLELRGIIKQLPGKMYTLKE
jgi:DNA processing protein